MKNKQQSPTRVTVAFTGRNWSAYSPDVRGVIATGETLNECIAIFREALDFHLDGLKQDRLPLPKTDTDQLTIFATVGLEFIKAIRRKSGLTQSDIAKELRLPQPRIAEIERNPASVSFGRMSQYLEALRKLARIEEPISLSS